MRHVAVIGSGPAGFYTAEAALKAFGDGVCVDLIDRLPVPYGLIRFGVAPDHQSIKAVSRRYEQVALSDRVRFVGNVSVGQDVSIAELQSLYDAVVLPDGRGAADALCADAFALHFVAEAYKHAKPVAAIGAGAGVLNAARLPVSPHDGGDPANAGVIVAETAGGEFVDRFTEALAGYRFFARPLDRVPA